MLVINYNGNKPTTDYFKYSVQGNNNADVVCFSLATKQGKLDLNNYDYKVYVRCKCEDDDFVDKVEITNDVSVVSNQLLCKWTLLRKHTVNRQLLVSLSFEDSNNEVVFQTQLVKITIANGIDVDEEIANTYPTILQQLIDKVFVDKDFVHIRGQQITFDTDVHILIGSGKRSNSKGLLLNKKCKRGKTFGNTITDFSFEKGNYSLEDVAEKICETNVLTRVEVQGLNQYFEREKSNGFVFITPFQELKKYVQNPKPDNPYYNNYCRRIDIKFVQNYSQEVREHGSHRTIIWSGNMAKNYLKCLINFDNDNNQMVFMFTPSRY